MLNNQEQKLQRKGYRLEFSNNSYKLYKDDVFIVENNVLDYVLQFMENTKDSNKSNVFIL